MGYTIEGILTNLPTASKLKHKYNDAILIQLYTDLVMIPITDELYEAMHEGEDIESSKTTRTSMALTVKMEQFCADLSRHNKVAFIEAEYFGGIGTQHGIVWEQGKVILEEIGCENAINQSLACLGVKRIGEKDEFDTVGLGRHRSIEGWVRENIRNANDISR